MREIRQRYEAQGYYGSVAGRIPVAELKLTLRPEGSEMPFSELSLGDKLARLRREYVVLRANGASEEEVFNAESLLSHWENKYDDQ